MIDGSNSSLFTSEAAKWYGDAAWMTASYVSWKHASKAPDCVKSGTMATLNWCFGWPVCWLRTRTPFSLLRTTAVTLYLTSVSMLTFQQPWQHVPMAQETVEDVVSDKAVGTLRCFVSMNATDGLMRPSYRSTVHSLLLRLSQLTMSRGLHR